MRSCRTFATRCAFAPFAGPDLLFGVGAFDPMTLLGVAGFIAVVATLASAVPARRAMAIDPMVALKHE